MKLTAPSEFLKLIILIFHVKKLKSAVSFNFFWFSVEMFCFDRKTKIQMLTTSSRSLRIHQRLLKSLGLYNDFKRYNFFTRKWFFKGECILWIALFHEWEWWYLCSPIPIHEKAMLLGRMFWTDKGPKYLVMLIILSLVIYMFATLIGSTNIAEDISISSKV